MLDFYNFKTFGKYDGLIHAVSTKSSDHAYNFSLALHTGENTSDIISNRKMISSLLHSENDLHFVVANQTHSDNIKVIALKKTRGWESLADAVEDCDALVSNEKNIVLTILTADCVPILLFDREKKVIAAVHAGWKGTQSQILAKTVLKMKEVFACDPKDIIAGLAPSIGPCCYEVGEDVAKHFFDTPAAFTNKGDKFMLDLPSINKQQLLQVGLPDENIEMSGLCTACEVERFFSYRKEQGCSGRFMSMIGMV